MLAVCKNKQLS